MFQVVKKRLQNEKGLSLVELLAVIVILAIVAAIAIPAIGNIIANSRDKAILSEATNILSGAKIAHMDKACGSANTCDATDLEPFVDGIDLTGTEVTLNGSDWEITFPKFNQIRADGKFKGFNGQTSLTENEIKRALEAGKAD